MNQDYLLLVGIVLGIFVFVLIREIVCWYFKINKQVELLKLMLETMLKMYEKEGGDVNWKEVKRQMNM